MSTVKDETKCGVYCIRNIASNKRYIGSTGVSFKKRWSHHRHALQKGDHRNRHLSNSWNCHGEESFVFEILEVVESGSVLIAEKKWIDFYRCTDQAVGFNVMPMPGSAKNYKHSAETRAKISRVLRGRPGRPISESHKRRLIAMKRGVPRSDATREKLSKALKGRSLSAETRAKMSAARTGTRRSEETRLRMSDAQKGKTHTVAAKAKMSAAKIGKKQSPESIANRLRGKLEAKLRREAA